MPRQRVLVVDDDETLCLLISEVLAIEGYDVKVAADAVEGMAILKRLDPAIVVLDYMMPAGGGSTFHRALRANPQWKDKPVLMLSAAPESTIAKGVDMDGRTYFLAKPYGRKDLLAIVQQILEENPPAAAL
ncbi:MAG: response regulator [Elusimicrobia bacterium]|nr:response regulator [Elusimicrobiota bacterium]